MPAVHDDHRPLLDEVEVVLQFLSHPEHLTEPDGEVIRAMLCEGALDKLRKVLNDK